MTLFDSLTVQQFKYTSKDEANFLFFGSQLGFDRVDAKIELLALTTPYFLKNNSKSKLVSKCKCTLLCNYMHMNAFKNLSIFRIHYF